MKVADIIKTLSEFPPDAEVMSYDKCEDLQEATVRLCNVIVTKFGGREVDYDSTAGAVPAVIIS